MRKPAIPGDEEARLARLRALDVLYTPASRAYDEVVRLAQLRFNVPIAMVTLVAEDEQWFKSSIGLDASCTSRDVSFCGHAIHSPGVFVVEDALDDPRFADNPLVTKPPHIRFYAGFPLRLGPGSALGTLCIIDYAPRKFSASDAESLVKLGTIVRNLLEQRTQDVELAADLLGVKDGLSGHAMIDAATGDWHIDALDRLLEPLLRQAKSERKLLGMMRVRPRVDGLDGRRLLIRDIARGKRLALPDRALHFYDGAGNFLSLVLLGSDDERAGIADRLQAEVGSADISFEYNDVSIDPWQPDAPVRARTAIEGLRS